MTLHFILHDACATLCKLFTHICHSCKQYCSLSALRHGLWRPASGKVTVRLAVRHKHLLTQCIKELNINYAWLRYTLPLLRLSCSLCTPSGQCITGFTWNAVHPRRRGWLEEAPKSKTVCVFARRFNRWALQDSWPDREAIGVHVGATWRIRFNDAFAVWQCGQISLSTCFCYAEQTRS